MATKTDESCERQRKFRFVGRLTFASALAVLQQFCIIYSEHFANNASLPLPLAAELDSVRRRRQVASFSLMLVNVWPASDPRTLL